MEPESITVNLNPSSIHWNITFLRDKKFKIVFLEGKIVAVVFWDEKPFVLLTFCEG
jgi:hypothetical protein